MSEAFGEALVGLVASNAADRRTLFDQYRPVIFSEAFVQHVQNELAAASMALIRSYGRESSGLPDVISEAMDEGSRLWVEGLTAVFEEMVAYAEAVDAAEQSQQVSRSTQPGTAATGSGGSGVAMPLPDNPGPSDEELFQDFLADDRRRHDDFRDDLEFNRIRDDAIAYSEPSYDSYDSYSSDHY